MKILCMLKRKPGLSRAEFKAYYEANHVPLIERLLPFYHEYRRNFLADTQDYETGHLDNKVEAEPDYDVVTELTFANKADYEKLIAALSDPAIGGAITRDEEQFMDRSKMAVYLVDEVKSPVRGAGR